MFKDRKFKLRWFFLGFLIGCVLFLILAKTERAEAATTSNGVYYPDLLTEVDLGEYRQHVEEIVLRNQYLVVTERNGIYNYAFLDKAVDCGKMSDSFVLNYSNFDTITYNSTSGVINFMTYNAQFRLNSGSTLYVIGSNFDYRRGWSQLNSFPFNNLSYPSIPPSGPVTTVSIDVGDNSFDITEYLEYYLALKESDGSIRLFFSDIPFTGDDVDLYTRGFYADITSTIITYYWDVSEQNSFLDSRTVLTGPFFQRYSYLTKTMTDYICNYNIFKTSSLLDIYLPEKTYFTSPEDILTAEDLFSVMPDELYNYNYCIVFRQQSPNAYDNRIVFYGWNETSANLYILKKNSQIAALTNKSVVSDFVTAYYDPDFATWVISDDVVLGATTDYSFNLPYIYHSDVDLFVCDEWRYWDYVGYMGDANRPIVSFEEPEEDDGVLSRLFNGLSNLFKKLFVPSTGFLNSKVGYMKSKFVFYESICDTINVIVDFFTETDYSEPPKFYINLSKSRSKYDYGDTAVCLDMSWYAEYKPAVDAFLSAVIWIVFAWNTFRNLPNIIAGIASGGNVTTTIIKGVQPPEPQASAISKNAMKEGTSYARGL